MLPSSILAAGLPAAILLHWLGQCSIAPLVVLLLHQVYTWCSTKKEVHYCCITTEGCDAAFHCKFQCTTTELWCIGVRSAGESCRSHKVRTKRPFEAL
eukprot:symbB.v1.2.040993.t1/scaffold7719.1/size11670/1